jgi:hypothetical protein
MLVQKVSQDIISTQSRKHWLDYWKHFSDSRHAFCAEVNCLCEQEQAVLVTYPKLPKHRIFVIPLCQKHSDNLVDQLEVNDDIEFVPCDLTL